MKKIKNRFPGATLNDVVYTIFCEALKRLQAERTGTNDFDSKRLEAVLAFAFPSKKQNLG